MTELEQRVILARARVDELRDLLIDAEREKQVAIQTLIAERQQAARQAEYVPAATEETAPA